MSNYYDGEDGHKIKILRAGNQAKSNRIDELIAEIEKLKEENRQLKEKLAIECHNAAGLTVEVERLRKRNAALHQDVCGWVQLAEKQYSEMPNASHNPLAPTRAGIDYSRLLLGPAFVKPESE